MATQIDNHKSRAWVERMRARGIEVREARPGAKIEPFQAVRQAGPLVALWRRTMRRLREKRVVS